MINKRIFTYLSIGVIDTLVDILILSTLVFLFGTTTTNILIFNSLSYSFVVYLSFRLNGKFTFKDDDLTFKKFTKLYFSSLFGLILNTIIVLILINTLNTNIVISKIISACIVVFYNYTMCRKFIFRSKNENTAYSTKI